jgi:hypothetical protein
MATRFISSWRSPSFALPLFCSLRLPHRPRPRPVPSSGKYRSCAYCQRFQAHNEGFATITTAVWACGFFGLKFSGFDLNAHGRLVAVHACGGFLHRDVHAVTFHLYASFRFISSRSSSV